MGSPVVISLGTPKWLPEAKDWPRLWEACPRPSYFHAEPAEFDRRYIEQLERYGARHISKRLRCIAQTAYLEPSDRLCLLCWEISGAPQDCHRGLLADWILITTGEKVVEITP